MEDNLNNPINPTAPMNAPNPSPSSTPPIMPARSSGVSGSLIALIVILALLIVGGLYFWKERGNYMESGTPDTALQSINSQSSSDDAAAIEADLNATDVNNVDYDLNDSNFTAS